MHLLSSVTFLYPSFYTCTAMTILYSSHLNGYTMGFVQTDATTHNIVVPIMVGVVACVLAVVCKQMQQLPTSLGPAVHRGKDTTHKSL